MGLVCTSKVCSPQLFSTSENWFLSGGQSLSPTREVFKMSKQHRLQKIKKYKQTKHLLIQKLQGGAPHYCRTPPGGSGAHESARTITPRREILERQPLLSHRIVLLNVSTWEALPLTLSRRGRAPDFPQVTCGGVPLLSTTQPEGGRPAPPGCQVLSWLPRVSRLVTNFFVSPQQNVDTEPDAPESFFQACLSMVLLIAPPGPYLGNRDNAQPWDHRDEEMR